MSLYRQTSLKQKLYSLNVFYLILLGIVGFFYVSYNGLIGELSERQRETGRLTESTRAAAFTAKDYLAGRTSFENLEAAFQPFLRAGGGAEEAADAQAIWSDLQAVRGIRQENAAIEAEIEELMAHSISQSNGYIQQVSEKLADPDARHDVTQLERLVIIGASVNTSSSYEIRLLFQELKENPAASDRMFSFLETLLSNVEKDVQRLKGTPFAGMAVAAKEANLRVKELTEGFLENTRKANALQESVFDGLERAMAGIRKAELEINEAFTSQVKGYFQMIAAVLIVVSVLGVGLSLLLARRLSGALDRIIRSLSDASSRITSAAGQVSASGHSLAEGASEQAASIEETSSSLEEISSMTRRNAENTQETNRVMVEEVGPNFRTIGERMARMKEAIEKTVANSDETAKIVKTIDEIAFQTNLLALNAAVEAARAGEAGAGFAVVADEVRNLAMRAAEAAKNTSELIHTSNDRIKEAARLNDQVVESLDVNTALTEKVGKLIDDVAAASQEQARGIDQISTAVAEMDKVTQQTASGAEESAGASEEMNAQAREMSVTVRELIELAEGCGDGEAQPGSGRRGNRSGAGRDAAETEPGERTPARQLGDRVEIRPDQVIPFEESV
jgi:methyl-accepting chemotaxis protein